MSIALSVEHYLSEHHIPYDVMLHQLAPHAMATAQAAHIPGDDLVKAVVCRESDGYVLALMPSTHRLDLESLSRVTGQAIEIAEEDEMADLFGDCDVGAVPATGEAYGLRVVWDDELAHRSHLYFEGGDHRTLVGLDREDFVEMMGYAPHAPISRHI